VRSVPSPTDDLFDVESHSGAVRVPEDYTEYLQGGILPQDLMPQVDMASGSASGSRHSSAFDLRELGLADSDLSDHPDFLAGGESDDESRPESESDGELSNVNTMDMEDEDDGPDDFFDEVPNPPQLPVVTEERLQEAWPLGDASFGIFLCPITHDVMTDPVVSADGYTYERAAIARWFETSRKSPVTGQTLPHIDLVPNQSVRTLLKMLIDMTDTSSQEKKDETPREGEEVADDSEHSAKESQEPQRSPTAQKVEELCAWQHMQKPQASSSSASSSSAAGAASSRQLQAHLPLGGAEEQESHEEAQPSARPSHSSASSSSAPAEQAAEQRPLNSSGTPRRAASAASEAIDRRPMNSSGSPRRAASANVNVVPSSEEGLGDGAQLPPRSAAPRCPPRHPQAPMGSRSSALEPSLSLTSPALADGGGSKRSFAMPSPALS